MTETTATTSAGPALEALRNELDEIDDGLLGLLAKRFRVTAQVRSFKQATTKTLQSPLRPAREAEIHRRLVAKGKVLGLDPALVLRLWRAVLSQSSLAQTPMTLHVSKRLSQTMGHRLRLRDHFAAMPVEEWRDEAQVLAQVGVNESDICVVEAHSPWIEPFAAGQAGTAQVIGTLPLLGEGDAPQLLIIGNALSEPTGRDETLLLTKGNLPRDFGLGPRWQIKAGAYRITALSGYLHEHEAPLVGLSRSNVALGLKVIGHYPQGFEGGEWQI